MGYSMQLRSSEAEMPFNVYDKKGLNVLKNN